MKIRLALTISMLATLGASGCGTSKDAGLGIGLSLSPNKAYIVSGKGVSCKAQASARKADTVPVGDIEGDRVLFNRFAIQWRSGDQLTIASIKATVFSSGIDGADKPEGFEFEMPQDEAAALLGLTDLTIPFSSSPFNADRSTTIDSTDPTLKSASKPYAPCGFQIGSLPSKKDSKTYTARIRVEVTGFRTRCVLDNTGTCTAGDQLPVRQNVTVTAEKF